MREVRIFPRATERWQECIARTRWWQALCEFFNNAHFFSLALHEQLSLWRTLGAQYKRRSILISWKYDEALWEKINCIATSYIFREATSWEIYEMFIVSTEALCVPVWFTTRDKRIDFNNVKKKWSSSEWKLIVL